MIDLDEQLEEEFFPAEPPPAGGAVWMLSFADLLSVLLTFFVMLYSTTAVQNEKWEEFLKSFHSGFQQTQKAPTIEAHLPDVISTVEEKPGNDLDYLRTILTEKSSSFPELAKGKIIRTKGQLTFSFPLELFYSEGVYLSKEAQPVISSLATVFDLINNRIDVAVVIPKGEKGGDLEIWQDTLLQAYSLAGEVKSYGYRQPINAYSYMSVHLKDTGGDDTKPRVDFIIRDTANPSK